jgi:hypothetical protein
METSTKKSFLTGIPSWASALIALSVLFIVVMTIPESDDDNPILEVIAYIIYGVLNALCCFFIVKQNPKSIWYVPLIINSILIYSAVVERNFWITSMWIFVCSGWILCLVASIVGARIGNRAALADKS